MAHKFTEHKDGRLDIEGQRIVLKRGTMTISHQVIDQALVAIGSSVVCGRRFQGLFSLCGNSRGKENVGVAGAVPNQFHRHISTKFDVLERHRESSLQTKLS